MAVLYVESVNLHTPGEATVLNGTEEEEKQRCG